MGALGNYIHHSWSNYDEYGVYSKNDTRARSEPPSTALFERFRQAAYSKARASLKSIGDKDLRALENNYNKQRQKLIQALAAAGAKVADGTASDNEQLLYNNIMEKALESSKLASKFDPKTIASITRLDGNRGTLEADMNSVLSRLKTKASGGKGKQVIYSSSIDKNFQAIEKAKAIYKEQLGITTLPEQITKLEEDMWKALEKLKEAMGISNTDALKGKIPLDLVRLTQAQKKAAEKAKQPIELKLLDIQKKIINVLNFSNGVIAQLEGGLEEVMGPCVNIMMYHYGRGHLAQELNDVFDDLMKKQWSGATPSTGATFKSIKLDADSLAEIKSSIKDVDWDKMIENNSLKVNYSFAQGKADFIFKPPSTINKTTSYGISAKAYNLDQGAKSPTVPAHISLQSGSSAYLYLGILEQTVPTAGNHLLNVFTEHTPTPTNDPSSYAFNPNYYEQARQVLLTQAFITSMSGIGQNTQLADIFYIYDKSRGFHASLGQGLGTIKAPRVHFFSINSLLQDIMVSTGGQDIENFVYFSDNPIFEYSNKFESRGPAARITKVLAQARAQRFSVGLRTEFIKEKIKSGYKNI